MSANYTSFLPLLKEMVQDYAEDCAYEPSPALALIAHKKDFFGESYRVPLNVEDVQGGGSRFADAQAGAAASAAIKRAFSVTHGIDYSIARTSGSLLRRGEKNAIIDAMKDSVRSAMNTLACSLSHQLYRDGTGSRGTIVYSAGATFQCTNADDIAHFKQGMRLLFASSTTAAVRSTTVATITSIDEDGNTVTTDQTLSGLGVVTGDTVFRAGDRDPGATPTPTLFRGRGAWIPTTAPSGGDSFFGVDRSVNVNRLAGSRWAPTTYSPEDLLINGLRRLNRRGGKASHIFCGTAFYSQVATAMQTRGVVPLVDVKTARPGIGFTGIDIISPHGKVTLLSDLYCQPDRVWITNVDSWAVRTAGDTIRMADEDADRVTLSTEDMLETRMVSEGNFVCTKPVDNLIISLPSAPA